MKGINFITDNKNNKVGVIINLKKHDERWEDFYDVAIASASKGEAVVSLAEVKQELEAVGKVWCIELR